MRRFVLQRDEDETGVSGIGVVAEGVQFSDGRVVLRWFGEHSSIVVWNSVEDVLAVHGHNGRTRVVWSNDRDNGVVHVPAPMGQDDEHGFYIDCSCGRKGVLYATELGAHYDFVWHVGYEAARSLFGKAPTRVEVNVEL